MKRAIRELIEDKLEGLEQRQRERQAARAESADRQLEYAREERGTVLQRQRREQRA